MGHTTVWRVSANNTTKGMITLLRTCETISTLNLCFSFKANVTIVSRADCNVGNSYDGEILESMICAAAEGGGGGIDACQGDSGGPLVALNPPNDPAGDDTFRLKQKYNLTNIRNTFFVQVPVKVEKKVHTIK